MHSSRASDRMTHFSFFLLTHTHTRRENIFFSLFRLTVDLVPLVCAYEFNSNRLTSTFFFFKYFWRLLMIVQCKFMIEAAEQKTKLIQSTTLHIRIENNWFLAQKPTQPKPTWSGQYWTPRHTMHKLPIKATL